MRKTFEEYSGQKQTFEEAVDATFLQYADALSEMEQPTYEEACLMMEQNVYKAAMLFERLENMGLIHGNGHHAAQKIAGYAVEDLKKRWIGEKP